MWRAATGEDKQLKDWIEMPDGEVKRRLEKNYHNEFLIRFMPYDLWWRARHKTTYSTYSPANPRGWLATTRNDDLILL